MRFPVQNKSKFQRSIMASFIIGSEAANPHRTAKARKALQAPAQVLRRDRYWSEQMHFQRQGKKELKEGRKEGRKDGWM